MTTDVNAAETGFLEEIDNNNNHTMVLHRTGELLLVTRSPPSSASSNRLADQTDAHNCLDAQLYTTTPRCPERCVLDLFVN